MSGILARFRFSNMAIGLAIGVTLAVGIACGVGSYLYSLHHYRAMLESARTAALAQGQMIKAALEHQMMENDRGLIDQMIQRFGAETGVNAVMLLDRHGRPRYSSVTLRDSSDFVIASPTCQACHRLPPEARTSSQVIDTPGGEILRTVIPIQNREPCHRCHDPNQRINGVLIVDVNSGEMRAATNRDIRWMAAGSALLVLVLIAAIGTIFRLVVMRRLQHFETAARLIAAGDLDRRVPEEGSDIISWLAREFNLMAASTTGLLNKVRDQREQLEKVINSINDAIVVLDSDRKVIAANDAFLRRSGRDRGEVLGSSCGHATSGTCGPVDCPTLGCLHTGEAQIRIYERGLPTGDAIVEEVHSSPILDAQGHVSQVVEVWRDISKRRAAEAQLAEAHRMASLGMLASGFSHEMNTPLATVLVIVEGILRSAQSGQFGANEDSTQIAERARIAREQLIRCRGITQHFLHLSSGRSSPAEIVDAGAALASVMRLIAPTARSNAIEVDLDPVPDGIRIRVSDADLQHVLLNLALNAVQACRAGGHVRMGARGGETVCFWVQDDGCGIAPEDQKRIFEPFCSLRKGGTGLGLFLSMDSVRRWGGEIIVQSAPGAGTTFEVCIPSAGPGGSREGIQT
jgi:PAS domain S-box-containing protein